MRGHDAETLHDALDADCGEVWIVAAYHLPWPLAGHTLACAMQGRTLRPSPGAMPAMRAGRVHGDGG